MEFEQNLREQNDELGFMRKISRRENDASGRLDEIPFVVKDAICAEGVETSAGSRILRGYEPVFDATVVSDLESAGAEFYGKTNQDEFGFGSFCLNCAFETPKNPHDIERVVGGSSGGAAAVCAATDRDIVSIGESTGGSITNPAAYNGVYGLTPTYGRVSRNGLVDYANSLDKIGVLSSSLELVGEAFEVIAGHDPEDETTVKKEVPDLGQGELAEDLRVGVPNQLMDIEIQDGVRRNFQHSLDDLRSLGMKVEEIDVPMLSPEKAVPAYYIMAMAEASTNLARFSGMRYGAEEDPEEFEDFNSYFSQIRGSYLGEEAKRRVLLGTYARKAGYRDQYYLKAAKVRKLLLNQLKDAFAEYDIIAAPSMPNIAPRRQEARDMDPSEIYAMDALTVGPNLAGVPQLSIPIGTYQEMPTGLQIISEHWEEKLLIQVARNIT